MNLGHAQSDVWNVEDAEKNLTKALKVYKALQGENHRIVAATLNYLGYAYEQSGKVQQGKEMLEKAVGIMDKNYPPSHPGNPLSYLFYIPIYLSLWRIITQNRIIVQEQWYTSS